MQLPMDAKLNLTLCDIMAYGYMSMMYNSQSQISSNDKRQFSINKVQSKVLNINQEDNSNNNLQDTSNNTTISREQQTQTGCNNSQVQANNNPGTSTVPTTSSRPNSTLGYVVIPYTKGLVENSKHICGKYGIQTYFKGNTTIKYVLMKPKDQGPKKKKSVVIYSFQCNHIDCDEEYIGETAKTLGERCKEHLKQPSPIYAHIQQTGHNTTEASFNIIGREDQGQTRTIRESYLHKGIQSNIKPKHWYVQNQSYIEQSSF